jgi:hypothetical protein
MERSPEFRRRVGSDVIDEGVIARAMRRGGRGAGRVEAPDEPVPEPVDGRPAPQPEFVDVAPVPTSDPVAQARRDKRRQRRRTRPHGRAR